MIVADLHVHTTASDGTMTISEAIAAARSADLAVIAVTDHDCLHPVLEDPITYLDGEDDPVAEPIPPEEGGLAIVRGIEVRVDTGGEHIDLLGYGVRPTEALTDELDRLGRNRRERGQTIVDRVEKRLSVDLDLVVDESVGRPHIARAIAASDAPYDYGEAFGELIGDDGPCYVARELPSVEAGAGLLDEACAVVSLAHPFRYRNPKAALACCEDGAIDAVERWYPYGEGIDVDTDLIEATIAEHDLIATGGSDAHDDVLGRAGLSPAAYDPIERRLSKP
jgi:3',5'-nucleoside bisphosphate phosphatase